MMAEKLSSPLYCGCVSFSPFLPWIINNITLWENILTFCYMECIAGKMLCTQQKEVYKLYVNINISGLCKKI